MACAEVYARRRSTRKPFRQGVEWATAKGRGALSHLGIDKIVFSVFIENMSERNESPDQLTAARDEFISQWGAMGGAWGINRTMAQVHALLMTSERALTTDEVMAELKISRGNAHQNLRELVGWGLVRSVIRKGERKEYFESEKDVWRMFCTIARERKRREVEPALRVLRACEEQTRGLRGEKAAAFNKQIRALTEFVAQADMIMDRASKAERSTLVPLLLRMLPKGAKGTAL
jgi:DNA-binding transcriptional regulator GbsR (MarR family)